jgi:hypothetical protein
MNKLAKSKWILMDKNLDGASKFHLFQALFRSRVSYAMNILAYFDRDTAKWFKSYWYQSIKTLLNIGDNIKMERLFSFTLGESFESFLEKEQ